MVSTANGDTGAYPFPPFPRVASSQPFTMRDGMSYLAILQRIQKGYTILQDEWDKFLDDAKDWGDSVEKLWKQFLDKYTDDFTKLHDELISLIEQASATENIVVWSSAYGRRVPLQTALDDIYDADRDRGLFVQDFDNIGISPAVFDAIGVPPRVFDLNSSREVNTVAGDIGTKDIRWLEGVPDPHPSLPDDITILDERYLKRNPTAEEFSSGN